MKHHLIVGSSDAQILHEFERMQGVHMRAHMIITNGETITRFRVAKQNDDSIRGLEFQDVRFLSGVLDREQYLLRRRPA